MLLHYNSSKNVIIEHLELEQQARRDSLVHYLNFIR